MCSACLCCLPTFTYKIMAYPSASCLRHQSLRPPNPQANSFRLHLHSLHITVIHHQPSSVRKLDNTVVETSGPDSLPCFVFFCAALVAKRGWELLLPFSRSSPQGYPLDVEESMVLDVEPWCSVPTHPHLSTLLLRT